MQTRVRKTGRLGHAMGHAGGPAVANSEPHTRQFQVRGGETSVEDRGDFRRYVGRQSRSVSPAVATASVLAGSGVGTPVFFEPTVADDLAGFVEFDLVLAENILGVGH